MVHNGGALSLLAALFLAGSTGFAAQEDEVIDGLIGKMTLEEKIGLIASGRCTRNGAVLRLGITSMNMSDGPHGLAKGPTALPDGIGLAATWDTDCATRFGTVLGRECRANGVDVLLGPAINIQRSPLDARINEYYSEDPILTGEMIVPVVKAIQSNDVIAQVKHYVCFNQETNRRMVDVKISERALREIYLPHWFRLAREAEPLAIMASYNWLRGEQAAQNPYTLKTLLKGEMAFEGFVMTDWDSRITAYESAMNGLDVEVCTKHWHNELKGLVEQGTVPLEVVDDKVRRVLRAMYRVNMLPGQSRSAAPTRTQVLQEHKEINREIAEASIVLLKNEGVLPLEISGGQNVAVIGENAVAVHANKGQCNAVQAAYEITPLMGLDAAIGERATITFARGYSDGESIPHNEIHDRYVSGADFDNSATVAAQRDAAVAAAGSANHVLLFGGSNRSYNSCSHADRTDIELHGGQNELIAAVAAANPNTVVILVGGGPVTMPWLDKVKTVVQVFPGSAEIGSAVAHVLLGHVNPSGKLPITFPRKLSDAPAHATAQTAGGEWTDGIYREGILVGYRWFDAKGIEPLFPFGHGLSYTSFDYENLQVAPELVNGSPVCRVSCNLTNAGTMPGAEVAQVYVQDVSASAQRPVKELKGFSKVQFGEAGVTKTVTIDLDSSAFAFYDEEAGAWKVEPGEFKILVGASSRDIRLAQSIAWPLSVPVSPGGNNQQDSRQGRLDPGPCPHSEAEIRVMDIAGRVVQRQRLDGSAWRQVADALPRSQTAAPGTYLISVSLKGGSGASVSEEYFTVRRIVE